MPLIVVSIIISILSQLSDGSFYLRIKLHFLYSCDTQKTCIIVLQNTTS